MNYDKADLSDPLLKINVKNFGLPQQRKPRIPKHKKERYDPDLIVPVMTAKKKKTFSQFQEDVDSMKATMKGFADTIVPQMKTFAKSKEVKDLKKNAMNLLINKGYEALNKGKKKLGEFEKKVR